MSKFLKRSAHGAEVPPEKRTSNLETVVMPLPSKIVLSMSQHIGAPATPAVAKGDQVYVGSVVGKAGGFVSSDIHSGVSGTVDSITTIKELVARGLGVTIIAYSAVKADVMKGNLSVIPVENLSMPREINLVYHKDFEHKEILNEIYRIYQEEKNLAGEGRLT